ncbi:hypothetical protein HON52_00760 [Candidatus Uhrbacteria bacterium]|jgi:hypothetical protein|nr:hypothetical protein [Candidatus Uhrbacteria bacterium]
MGNFSDLILETIRAIPLLFLFFYLLRTSKKNNLKATRGWHYLMVGFGLLLFASLIDITDNFESLGKYVVIGDTGTQAFLEKVVGYLGGFIFLALWAITWLPNVLELNKAKEELAEANKQLATLNKGLEESVKERTVDLKRSQDELLLRNTELMKSQESLVKQNEALEKFSDAIVGRELKMLELKKQLEIFKQDSDSKE